MNKAIYILIRIFLNIGVQAENTVRILFDTPEAAIALRLKDTEDHYLLSKIVDNARAKIVTEYSGHEAKRTVSGRKEEEFDPNRQFCTRFLPRLMLRVGSKSSKTIIIALRLILLIQRPSLLSMMDLKKPMLRNWLMQVRRVRYHLNNKHQ